MGWHVRAVCRISSWAKQHFGRLRVMHFCILRVSVSSQVREASWQAQDMVLQVGAGSRKKFGGIFARLVVESSFSTSSRVHGLTPMWRDDAFLKRSTIWGILRT
jgi:hypothetical protein